MAIGPSWFARSRRRLDPGSRWPLLVLAFGALTIFLTPLGYDVFLAIPWSLRKLACATLVLVLAGLGVRRLLTVRPGDAWPIPFDADAEAEPTEARWLAWALQVAVASLAWPLLSRPEALGFGDWDYFLEKFETIRRILLDAHQFPWWTPWCRGGFPLASDPQCGVVSIATPLVLLFGTATGLRLAAVLNLMIAAEGARRLAWAWLREPWGAATAALIYAVNGGVLVYTVAGYFIPMSYSALPWMLLSSLRIGGRLRDGVGLGLWAGFSMLNGIQYPTFYGLVLAGLVWLRALRVQPRPLLGRLWLNTAAALGVGLALTGWRLATVASVLADFPRTWRSPFNASVGEVLDWLLYRPGPSVLVAATSTYFWETGGYVGPVALGLAVFSLRRGWRWWHTLTVLCLWLALGSVAWFHPSYWLAHGPIFSTMHVVTRWRIPAMLGLGLAAGSVVAAWRTQGGVWRRRLAAALVLIIAADLVGYGHQILPVATSVAPTEDLFPGPAVARLVNVEGGLGYPAVLRGYGVIRGYQPLLGYDRSTPTARLWRGDPAYRGEAWTEAGPLTPVFWSPNRIVFQAQPSATIEINQNPGSWWRVNGRDAFPRWRAAECNRRFVAQADAQGRLVLQIVPKGLRLGYALHAAGVALLVGVGLTRFANARRNRLNRPTGA